MVGARCHLFRSHLVANVVVQGLEVGQLAAHWQHFVLSPVAHELVNLSLA